MSTTAIVVFSVFGAIAAAGILYTVFSKKDWRDNAFLQTEEFLNGEHVGRKPIVWHQPNVTVYYAWNCSQRWVDAWEEATNALAAELRFKMFLRPVSAIPDLQRLMELDNADPKRQVMRGMILLCESDMDEREHAQTDIVFDKLTGEIRNIRVTFPTNAAPKHVEYIVTHELGHCHGLDHDLKKESIMYPYIQDRPRAFTDYDLGNLRHQYGPVLAEEIQ